MVWAEAMGLGDAFLSAPSRLRYPPPTLREAIQLSRSDDVTGHPACVHPSVLRTHDAASSPGGFALSAMGRRG